MPDQTQTLTEHVTLPWYVMLIALPLLLAGVLLAPSHFPAMATTIHLGAAGAAAYLGLHAPVPDSLKRRPAVAKLIAFAGGGGVAQLLYFQPLLAQQPQLQAASWGAVVFLSWLAGMPLTVGVSGQALPQQLVDAATRGSSNLLALFGAVEALLITFACVAWVHGLHALAWVLVAIVVLMAAIFGLALGVLSLASDSAGHSDN